VPKIIDKLTPAGKIDPADYQAGNGGIGAIAFAKPRRPSSTSQLEHSGVKIRRPLNVEVVVPIACKAVQALDTSTYTTNAFEDRN
jgi:hypothetical protein